MAKTRLSALTLLAALACLAAALPATKLYKGNWFSIRYPASFTVRKSGGDGAFFKSKGGEVEFYVFSPQWNGEPKAIAMDPKREKVVSQSIEQKGDVIVRRATFKAIDGKYTRSTEDREDQKTNTRRAFAIKCRDAKVLAKWRDAYASFKKSLVQYAD